MIKANEYTDKLTEYLTNFANSGSMDLVTLHFLRNTQNGSDKVYVLGILRNKRYLDKPDTHAPSYKVWGWWGKYGSYSLNNQEKDVCGNEETASDILLGFRYKKVNKGYDVIDVRNRKFFNDKICSEREALSYVNGLLESM